VQSAPGVTHALKRHTVPPAQQIEPHTSLAEAQHDPLTQTPPLQSVDDWQPEPSTPMRFPSPFGPSEVVPSLAPPSPADPSGANPLPLLLLPHPIASVHAATNHEPWVARRSVLITQV
jgi:hypothetical protein